MSVVAGRVSDDDESEDDVEDINESESGEAEQSVEEDS